MDVMNWRKVRSDLYSAGQPAPNEWQDIRNAGVRTVLNLRPDSEQPGFDESTLVERTGMRYIQLPVASGNSINLDCIRHFTDLITQYGKDGLLIHCGSGNRVGALLALEQHFYKGASIADAIAFGRKAGLTGLESRVHELFVG